MVDIKKIVTDYQWVIRILESSKDKHHMEVTINCFSLWESNYRNTKLSKSELNVLSELKSNFWSLYNDKNRKIELISI